MRKTLGFIMAVALLCGVAGCDGWQTSTDIQPTATAAAPSDAVPTPSLTPTPTPTPEPTQEITAEDIFPRNFSFCSGVGGWSTQLSVEADGSFFGYYHDSDIGVTGEDYPNGTEYYCSFTGQFSTPVKVNEYTYSMQLERLVVPEEEEKIEDEIRWIPSSAYGIEGGDEFLIYLPGAPMDELPEYFLDWVWVAFGESGPLPNYGLYNVATGDGWFSYGTATA